MEKPRLFIVGDSTLSSFNDQSYYYPRYGYGTQLYNFLNLEIINLALSGRSSKSYLLEENYSYLKESIKEGDFLLIGFGHNNEKSDDVARFTSANLPIDNKDSFMYSLSEFYIKLAKSVNATPILCTPIVRLALDGNYSGTAIHETEHGDYRKVILDLGKMMSILALDLTTPTKELFQKIGVINSSLHHAITAGKLVDGILGPNFKSVDKAHLNIYGAKYVAYIVAKGLLNSDCKLKEYLYEDILEPDIEQTLTMNPLFKMVEYKVPNFDSYKPLANYKVDKEGWYGTCFGDVGCNPLLQENGYIATSSKDGFIVGQIGDRLYGKFHASADGFACCFKQVPITDNFTIKVKAKVVDLIPSKQTSFGIMLRDDIYLNQTSTRESTMNNYVSAGFLTLNVSTNILFARECTTELNMANNIFNGFYQCGDEAILEIVRLGQSITTKVFYKEKEYVKTYMDFDLVGIDQDYMYVCLYSTCGTIIEYSDVEFIFTGKAIEA